MPHPMRRSGALREDNRPGGITKYCNAAGRNGRPRPGTRSGASVWIMTDRRGDNREESRTVARVSPVSYRGFSRV